MTIDHDQSRIEQNHGHTSKKFTDFNFAKNVLIGTVRNDHGSLWVFVEAAANPKFFPSIKYHLTITIVSIMW